MGEVMKGYRQVLPHIEYQQNMTAPPGRAQLRADVSEKRAQRGRHGGLASKGAGPLGDAAVESSAIPYPAVFTIPDILASIKLMAR